MGNDYKPWKNYGEKSSQGSAGHSPGDSDGSHDSQREDLNDNNKICSRCEKEFDISNGGNHNTSFSGLLCKN